MESFMKKYLLTTPLFLLGLAFSVTHNAFADGRDYASGYYRAPQGYHDQRSDYRYRDEQRYREEERHREDRRREDEHRDYHRGDR